MKKLFMGLSMMGLFVLLAGCHSMFRGNNAYLNAKPGPHLKVPHGLSSAYIGNEYSIPPVRRKGPVPAPIAPPK